MRLDMGSLVETGSPALPEQMVILVLDGLGHLVALGIDGILPGVGQGVTPLEIKPHHQENLDRVLPFQVLREKAPNVTGIKHQPRIKTHIDMGRGFFTGEPEADPNHQEDGQHQPFQFPPGRCGVPRIEPKKQKDQDLENTNTPKKETGKGQEGVTDQIAYPVRHGRTQEAKQLETDQGNELGQDNRALQQVMPIEGNGKARGHVRTHQPIFQIGREHEGQHRKGTENKLGEAYPVPSIFDLHEKREGRQRQEINIGKMELHDP